MLLQQLALAQAPSRVLLDLSLECAASLFNCHPTLHPSLCQAQENLQLWYLALWSLPLVLPLHRNNRPLFPNLCLSLLVNQLIKQVPRQPRLASGAGIVPVPVQSCFAGTAKVVWICAVPVIRICTLAYSPSTSGILLHGLQLQCLKTLRNVWY